MGGEFEIEPLEQKLQLSLRLGVAGEYEFTPVGGGDVHIEHLHGGEFVEHAARAQAARGGATAGSA